MSLLRLEPIKVPLVPFTLYAARGFVYGKLQSDYKVFTFEF